MVIKQMQVRRSGNFLANPRLGSSANEDEGSKVPQICRGKADPFTSRDRNSGQKALDT